MQHTKHRPQAANELLLALAEPCPVWFDRRVQSGGKLVCKGPKAAAFPAFTNLLLVFYTI